MARIFSYVVHQGGIPDDSAVEMVAAAKKIDPSATVTAIVTGAGPELDAVCDAVCASFGEVWKISGDAISYPNAEVVRKALVNIVPPGSILLVPHNHFGMDLSPGLSIKLGTAYVSDVVGIDGVDGGALNLVRQEFGGQISTHVTCDLSSGAILNIRSGAFPPAENAGGRGVLVDKSAEAGNLQAGRRYLETIVAAAGDVDITREEVLVSVGRGIQEQDNIAIVQELADAMGAVVSCSRPIVDAKWLEKSRQVGTSGKTVKPKVYFTCGISGSFQHLGGLKGNPFIIAIDRNPKAPIFQVADVGIVANLLEFVPELTAKIRAL
jgi:electron transfer flavoprotein alpha subunit